MEKQKQVDGCTGARLARRAAGSIRRGRQASRQASRQTREGPSCNPGGTIPFSSGLCQVGELKRDGVGARCTTRRAERMKSELYLSLFLFFFFLCISGFSLCRKDE